MRVSTSNWPLLDQKLFDWVSGHIHNGYPITGPLVQTKAAEIWAKIPEYHDQPKSAFSEGWLTRFKKRHNLRYHTFHGEAASVPSLVHDKMKDIRTVCAEYEPHEIYNMDETGLFWRQMPNGGLSYSTIAGKKKKKGQNAYSCWCGDKCRRIRLIAIMVDWDSQNASRTPRI